MWFFFFFQAEDGIRDLTVTGVQTCALPISGGRGPAHQRPPPTLTPAPRRTPPPQCARPAKRHGTPDPVRSNAVKARFQCVRQRTDRHDQHKLNGISLQQHGAPFMMYGSGTGVARVTKARFRYRPARSMAQMKDPVLAFRQNTSETSFNPKLLGGGMSPTALTWAFASSVAKSSGYMLTSA